MPSDSVFLGVDEDRLHLRRGRSFGSGRTLTNAEASDGATALRDLDLDGVLAGKERRHNLFSRHRRCPRAVIECDRIDEAIVHINFHNGRLTGSISFHRGKIVTESKFTDVSRYREISARSLRLPCVAFINPPILRELQIKCRLALGYAVRRGDPNFFPVE